MTKRRTNALWAGCAAAAVAGILAWNWSLRRPLENTDEAAWIFSTYYYRLAFVDHDFVSPAWRQKDAYDHPPLAKFYYGALLWPVDGVAHSLAAKEWWFSRTNFNAELKSFILELRPMIPIQVLQRARLGSTIAMAVACAVVGVMAFLLVSPWAACLAAMLMAALPLTRFVARQAISDGLLAAFLAVCALIQAVLASRLASARRIPTGLALACGVVAGLAFDVKISAALELVVLPASLAWSLPRKDWGRASAACAASLLAAVAAAVAVNPSLYHDAPSFVAGMFSHRLAILSLQRWLLLNQLHPNFLYRLAEAFNALFGPADPIAVVIGPVTALLFFEGLLEARARCLRRKEPAERVLLAHCAAWIAAAVWTFALRQRTYLLPAVPFACLLAALGAQRLRGAARAELACAAAATGVCLLLSMKLDTMDYWAKHADLRAQRAVLEAQRFCGRYPETCRAESRTPDLARAANLL